ncbi:MAG: LysR family transcriptional regulator [Gammaproteobacteria bacterium]|nr:LysR family transcriptional regulator [Gammaproteobacteria bacterium]
MWLASELAAFAQVVELRSFTASARALGVPKVAISRAVQSLEKRVGAKLLTRTTRRVALTDAGRALLPHAHRILAETVAARREISPLTEGRRTLRVLADPAYGRLLLAPLLPRFMERYPDIPLEVEMAQALPGEPGEQWDLLFQNGPPQREGLVGTPLGRPPVILCATPGYLHANPPVKQPGDLAQHAVLVPGHQVTELRLHKGRNQALVPLEPRLVVTDPAVVHAATAAGAGIGVLPEFLCRQGLATGKLARVLPDWQVADLLELHAVSDLRRARSPSVRALIEFFVANMVPVLGRT